MLKHYITFLCLIGFVNTFKKSLYQYFNLIKINQKAPPAGIRVRSSINCDSGCSAIYRIVFETLVEESIDVLSKSELIDYESQSGVFTEPRVIVHALIELDLSSSLKHLVNIARADFDTQ